MIDVNAGLSRQRIVWVKERGGVEEYQGRDIKPEDNGNVGASMPPNRSPRITGRCAASTVT